MITQSGESKSRPTSLLVEDACVFDLHALPHLANSSVHCEGGVEPVDGGTNTDASSARGESEGGSDVGDARGRHCWNLDGRRDGCEERRGEEKRGEEGRGEGGYFGVTFGRVCVDLAWIRGLGDPDLGMVGAQPCEEKSMEAMTGDAESSNKHRMDGTAEPTN
jgi:hypothetical protein